MRISLTSAHPAEGEQTTDVLELCEEDCYAQSPYCGDGQLTEELARGAGPPEFSRIEKTNRRSARARQRTDRCGSSESDFSPPPRVERVLKFGSRLRPEPNFSGEPDMDKHGTDSHPVTLRAMQIGDLWSIHRMYDSLSEESRRFLPSGILGLRSISWYWVLGQIALMLSCNSFARRLLRRVYPDASFFTLVALDPSCHDELVGFAYLRGHRPYTTLFLGICVKDSYQGLKIRSRLMEELLGRAQKHDASRIVLWVHAEDAKAISLYEKYRFEVEQLMMSRRVD